MPRICQIRLWYAAASRSATHGLVIAQSVAHRLGFLVLCALAIGWSCEAAWAQRPRTEANPAPRQAFQRPEPPPPPAALTPITFPATDPSTALGKALASCE